MKTIHRGRGGGRGEGQSLKRWSFGHVFEVFLPVTLEPHEGDPNNSPIFYNLSDRIIRESGTGGCCRDTGEKKRRGHRPCCEVRDRGQKKKTIHRNSVKARKRNAGHQVPGKKELRLILQRTRGKMSTRCEYFTVSRGFIVITTHHTLKNLDTKVLSLSIFSTDYYVL